jgi:large subunit ribosomal protein L24
MKVRLRKGDQVKVLLGKDRGRKGKIEKVLPHQGKVLVPGLNIVKKHVKPQSKDKPGGVVEIAKPLSVSKVALICPRCGQSTRVGIKLGKGKEKHRICRKCKQIIK